MLSVPIGTWPKDKHYVSFNRATFSLRCLTVDDGADHSYRLSRKRSVLGTTSPRRRAWKQSLSDSSPMFLDGRQKRFWCFSRRSGQSSEIGKFMFYTTSKL